jgi:hypothetical protein
MEAKPNMIKKYNKPVIGLIGGLILPALTFLLYYAYMSFTSDNGVALSDFIDTMYTTGAFTPILSLCVLPNLLLYVIFKKIDYWYAIKGVIVSVLAYTILVLILKFM